MLRKYLPNLMFDICSTDAKMSFSPVLKSSIVKPFLNPFSLTSSVIKRDIYA